MKTTIDVHLDENMQSSKEDLDKLNKVWDEYKGNHITITVEKYKRKRSNKQNRYFHGVVVPLVRQALNELGHEVSNNMTKDYLKKEFGCVTIDLVGDDYIEMPNDTSNMSTIEFMEFITKILVWGDEFLGITIPTPDQNQFEHESN